MKLITYLVVGHIAANWLCRRDWVAPFPAQTAVGFQASARSLFYTTILITILALAMPATANTMTLGLGAVGIFVAHRWGYQMLLPVVNQTITRLWQARQVLKAALQKGVSISSESNSGKAG